MNLLGRSLIFFSLIVPASVFAHDGPHGPEQKMAPHGGIIKETSNLLFELLKDESGVKVFAFTHDSKPLPALEVKVNSKKTQILDAKKKKLPLELKPMGDHFEVKFKENGSYKYDLTLVATYKGKDEKPVQWQIEPQQ